MNTAIEMDYTHNTILLNGPYKFKRLGEVPAKYLLKIYENGGNNKQLRKYIKDNFDEILNRPEDISNNVDRCRKISYSDEETVKMRLNEICKQSLRRTKTPIRYYKCEKCNLYHLTSKPYINGGTIS